MRQAALGPDAPQLAVDLVWIGVGLVASGRMAEAEQPLARALVLLDNPGGALALTNLDLGLESRLRGRAHLAMARIAFCRLGPKIVTTAMASSKLGRASMMAIVAKAVTEPVRWLTRSSRARLVMLSPMSETICPVHRKR